MTRGILRHADRDAIWHDPVSEPIRRTAGQVIPFPHQHHPDEEEAPEHDWTQHGLGDREDWEEENRFRHVDAALDAGGDQGFPGMGQLQPTGQELGTHKAQVHQDHQGQNWLVKQAPPSAPFLAHGDVAASAIQQYSGLKTPPTFLTESNGHPASAQLMFKATDGFPNKHFAPNLLSDPDLMTIQKHHALDWLLGNHDSHGGQFIRDDAGDLVGIDKGQAFKHYAQDRLHWNYHPNDAYHEQEPIYNTLYRNFAKGGREINDPRTGELGQFIQHLQDIPDDELASTLHPYAQGAAQVGALGNEHGGYSGHAPAQFESNNVAVFLKAAIDRKNNLMNNFGDLYDRAMAHRMTGTKIAYRRLATPPSEHEMHDEGEALGTNQRAQVFSDPQGQWIIKKPQPGTEYMVPQEVAIANLQRRVGLETPETHAIPFQGDLAVASKRYPNVSQAFAKRPHTNQLSTQDRETIQKHQALDWLIGNHDAHIGNWLRNNDTGQLIGIDKGQAGKYFGQDRLDPTFHPNYYAREPIYNRLWRDHANGYGEMADPRQGAVGDFVGKLQAIPDDELKSMFAPYAHAAASVGHLATGGPPDPERKLSPRSIPSNDPDAFLDAMVARKNNLHHDLGALYDKTTKARAQSQRSAPQPITPGLDPSYPLHEGARYAAPDEPPAPPKPPAVPTVPGTPPGTTPGTTPSAPTSSSATPAPGSTNTPGASPLTYTMPQGDQAGRKGPALSQHPWDAFGIPVGIPSTYQHTQDQLHALNPNSSNLNHPTNVQGDPYGNGAGSSTPGGGGGGGGGSTPSTTAPGGGGQGGPSAPTNYNPSAGVEQWRPHVEEGLRRNGLPVTPDYVNRVLHQMQTESSGNPKAINNTDSNAVAGTPSKGLLQTIDPTFQSHHLPGDANDPYDPQANIDAAINYAKGRYGPTLMDSNGNGMGSGHGY